MSIASYLRSLTGRSRTSAPAGELDLAEFLHFCRDRLDISVDLLENHDWRGIIDLWQPVHTSDFLDPQHPEWADKSWYRCQARMILMHLFTAHVHSHFGFGDERVDSKNAVGWAFRYLERLLADPPFIPDRFDSSLGQDAADASDHNLNLAFDTARQWFEMYGVDAIEALTDAGPGVVAAARRRLNDRLRG